MGNRPVLSSLPILTQSLMATARDGVDVRVLTPATNDIAWIGRASRAATTSSWRRGSASSSTADR